MIDQQTPKWLPLALALVLTGCGDSLSLGNYLLWHANHETGDLSQWAPPDSEGASMLDATVSDERSHQGTYALKLENTGGDLSIGVGFDFNSVREAYFSVWYYLPEAYADIESWLLMGFASRGSDCPDADDMCAGVDVRLRSLPSGELLLYVFNSEPDVLQPPLPDPPYYVPIARWFQIEARYRRATDHSGRFHLWVDGEPLFRFEGWRTAEFDNLFWGLAKPPTAGPILYADDAAISEIAVTPDGRLD